MSELIAGALAAVALIFAGLFGYERFKRGRDSERRVGEAFDRAAESERDANAKLAAGAADSRRDAERREDEAHEAAGGADFGAELGALGHSVRDD